MDRTKFITISIFLLFILISCNNSDKKTIENDKSTILKEDEKANIISMLESKYSAITDWEKIFKTTIVFTANLEKILVNSDNKPIIFVSQLADIKNQNGKHFMQFQQGSIFSLLYYNSYLKNIIFVLECDPSQFKNEIEKFDKENSNKVLYSFQKGAFVVVAKIQSVNKTIYKVEVNPISDEEAELQIELPDMFIATGVCLDLVYIENIQIDSKITEFLE